MIIVGEKINGAIPSIREAIAQKNDALIIERTIMQANAGADYLDCAPSTTTDIEYDTMCYLLNLIQRASDLPVCIDSPDSKLLARIISEGMIKKPGMINSVNEESDKCETIFPIIAGTGWKVIALTCDSSGIPQDNGKKLEIAKRIIDKADRYGVNISDILIDPCVMSLATTPSALTDFTSIIRQLHEVAPEVKVIGAISNISYNMPARKYINSNCMAYAMEAGLDAAILDPCNVDMRSAIYACDALLGNDTGGRKYNRAYRQGKVGVKKN